MNRLNWELHAKLHATIDKSRKVRHLAVTEVNGYLTVMAEARGGQIDWVVFDDDTGNDVSKGRSYDFDFDMFPTPIA